MTIGHPCPSSPAEGRRSRTEDRPEAAVRCASEGAYGGLGLLRAARRTFGPPGARSGRNPPPSGWSTAKSMIPGARSSGSDALSLEQAPVRAAGSRPPAKNKWLRNTCTRPNTTPSTTDVWATMIARSTASWLAANAASKRRCCRFRAARGENRSNTYWFDVHRKPGGRWRVRRRRHQNSGLRDNFAEMTLRRC